MSRSIEVSDEAYDRLQKAAAADGNTVADWIAELVRQSQVGVGQVRSRMRRNRAHPRTISLDDERRGMSRTVELSDDVYARIETEASAQRKSVAEWIATVAPKACAPVSVHRVQVDADSTCPAGKPPRTMADMLEGLIGQVSGNGPRDLAENHSKYFGEYLEEKKRAGRL